MANFAKMVRENVRKYNCEPRMLHISRNNNGNA